MTPDTPEGQAAPAQPEEPVAETAPAQPEEPVAETAPAPAPEKITPRFAGLSPRRAEIAKSDFLDACYKLCGLLVTMEGKGPALVALEQTLSPAIKEIEA